MKQTLRKPLMIIFSLLLALLSFLVLFSQYNVCYAYSAKESLEQNIKAVNFDECSLLNDDTKNFSNQTSSDKLNLNKSADVENVSGNEKFVYIGGNPIGILINAGGITILQSIGVLTANGMQYPAATVDIRKGDTITQVDGKDVKDLFSFVKAVEDGGDAVELTIRRGNNYIKRAIKPALDSRVNKKRLGILVKEEIGGVGTLTFSTENGIFGALGHRIYDSESGLFKELDNGKIYPVSINGVIKGEKGKAGGLQASINKSETPIGEIKRNIEIGLYGKNYSGNRGAKIRVAQKGEARMGHAQILTTINGTEPKLYNIDIVKTITQNNCAEKGLVIAVKDKELLEKTGGIVQGMSGSPIIQNGTLVGAVTHVFISDPTRGYGIHSRFMVEQAESLTA